MRYMLIVLLVSADIVVVGALITISSIYDLSTVHQYETPATVYSLTFALDDQYLIAGLGDGRMSIFNFDPSKFDANRTNNNNAAKTPPTSASSTSNLRSRAVSTPVHLASIHSTPALASTYSSSASQLRL